LISLPEFRFIQNSVGFKKILKVLDYMLSITAIYQNIFLMGNDQISLVMKKLID